MKQETLAQELGVSQQAVSKLEQSEVVEDDKLRLVAEKLGVTIDAIKNFDEEKTINVISSTFQDNAAVFNNYPTFNPIDKIVELYERMLKERDILIESLQRLIADKK